MIFIRCKYTYFCWDILWFWWWIFIWPATYLIFLSIVCNFATFFGLDTQNAEKNRLTDFLVAPKGAKRFWISYYTILNIVLYDFGYRTIRFRETLSDAAKPGWWGGARPLATCNPPLTLPSAMQMDVCGGNKCHTCRWGFRLAVMWLSIVYNHLIDSVIHCFYEAFAMLQRLYFNAWGVTLRVGCDTCLYKLYGKKFFLFWKNKNYTIGLRNKCHTQR